MSETCIEQRTCNEINLTRSPLIEDEIYRLLSGTYGIYTANGEIKRQQWLNKNQEDGDQADPTWKSPFLRFAGKDKEDRWSVHYSNIEDYCIKKFAVLNIDDRCYIYDETEGIYRENKNDIESTISNGLNHCGYAKNHDIERIVNGVTKRVRRANRVVGESPFNQQSGLMPCNNGVYNIRSGKLGPYSPLHGFTFKFPTNYDPDIDVEWMMGYLNGLVREGNERLIQQMLASIVLRDHFKKMYLVYNRDGNNGKSTFLTLVVNTFGKKNISNLSPQTITEGSFNSSQLHGKVANIDADIETKAICETSIIKKLTGYDPIYAQEKYKNPFNFVFHGVCIWGCNTPPRIHDDSDAFNRRVVPIEFPKTFVLDSQFYDDLVNNTSNHEALLKIALDYAPILLEDGPITTDIDQTKNELKMNSDSVYAFVYDMMEPDDRYAIVEPDPDDPSQMFDPSINYRNVHRQYKDYCNEKKFKPLGLKRFRDVLGDHSIQVIFRGSRYDQKELVLGARLKTKTVDVTNAPLSKFIECPE